jgi:hypothetical protein
LKKEELIQTQVIIWELGRILCRAEFPTCQLCKKKSAKTPRKGFVIHHFAYEKNEKTYADFEKRLQYHQYLAPIVVKNTERFLFLCNSCHFSLEKAVRFSDQKWTQLNKFRAKTLKMQNKN